MSATLAPSTKAPTETEADAEAGGGGRKKLVVIALVLALAAGAAYWFVLRPTGPVEPVAGDVVALDPIQVNLADGHYLSLGIALQLVEGTKEADGSKALDAAIEMFSGREMAELSKGETRVKLKRELAHELEESYEKEVMGVYFTQFVTQ